MGMVFCGSQRGANADGAIDRAIGGLGALLGGILDAEINRIHADLVGQFVNHAFNRECRHGGRGGAIGRDLGPVDDDFNGFRLDVLQVVAGKGGLRAKIRPGRRKRAALIAQHAVGGSDGAVALGADFHVNGGGAGGARGLEDFIPCHGELHRAIGLARKGKGQGFSPDMGLAAEAAADFRGGDAELGHIHAQQEWRSDCDK